MPVPDIKANGSDGPIAITYNTAATISWSSSNATSCSVAPSGWTGTSGSQSSGNLTVSQTYTLTCQNPNGSVSDSVTVDIGAPGNFTLNAPAPSCNSTTSRIALSWNAATGATNYKVYRNGALYQDVGAATSYTDSSVTSGTAYSYFIRATSASGGTTDSNTQNSTAVYCVGDIVVNAKLNGSAWTGASNIKYRLLGPGPTTVVNNATIPVSHTNKDLGVWTMDYQSGAPANSVFQSVTPSLSQTLPGGQISKPNITFTLNFVTNAPTVDLKANGSDGPVDILFSQAVTLSWTTTNATTCAASANPANSNWSGAKATSDSQSSGGLTPEGAKVFTLTCTGTGGSGNDSVTVNVTVEKPPDSGCQTAGSCISPVSLGSGSTCEQVVLTWTDNAPNETGFHVWRSPSFGGTTMSYGGRSYSQLATRPVQAGTGTVGTYTDGPGLSAGSYYYIVTAYNTGGESDVSGSNSIGPVVVSACVPDLIGSDKTLLQYRPTLADAWVNYDSSATLRKDYYLKFQVTIRNVGTARAYRVYLDDNGLTNLTYVGNPTFSGGAIQVDQISPTRVLFTAPPGQSLVAGSNWVLTFDTQITSSSTQTVDFFRNSGRVYYANNPAGPSDQSVPVDTGLKPFSTEAVRVPDIKEVAP